MMDYYIPACSGKRIDVKQGQTITVIDVEGGQVVDFLQRLQTIPQNFCLQALPSTAMSLCDFTSAIRFTAICIVRC